MTHRHHGHEHSGHGHTHGVVDSSFASTARGLWAVKWSFVGFVGNEAVAIFRIRVGRQIGSAALVVHVDPYGQGGERHHRIGEHTHDGLPAQSHDD